MSLGRIDGADLDRGCGRRTGIDLLQVRGGRRIDQRAGNRVAGHAAAEAVDAAGQLFLVAFAEEVDIGDDAARARRSCFWLRTLASSQPSPTRILIWLPTWPASAIEGSASSAHSVEALQVERDLRARAGDFEHDADRLARVLRFDGLPRAAACSALGACAWAAPAVGSDEARAAWHLRRAALLGRTRCAVELCLVISFMCVARRLANPAAGLTGGG